MTKRIKIDELTRLAFIYAEQDREAMFQSCRGTEYASEAVKAKELVDQLRAYRLKRWGRTELETTLEGATLVPLFKTDGSITDSVDVDQDFKPK